MTNNLKKMLLAGQSALGAQLRFGTPAIAELFGLAGFNFIVLDGEHAPQAPPGIQAQLQAIGCTQATPIVRVDRNDAEVIRLYLDMGAGGILVPFISTAEQAELGARACRYPPMGTRGYGPARAAGYGLNASYFREANDQVLYLPIIETAQAVENMDAILAVEGVDSFIVGPVDLSISLGIPFEFEHPVFTDALTFIAEAARRAGKPAGTAVLGDTGTPASYQKAIAQGFRLLLAGGDEWMLSAACKKVMQAFSQGKG